MNDFLPLDRRHFLGHLAGFSAMALPGMEFLQSLRAAAPEMKKENKSVIILWMGGGPATIDIWDLKPGETTGGEFKPIGTSAKGVEISEHMPQTAKQMKHLAIVRSLTTTEGDHNRGRTLMHTAHVPTPLVNWPSLGSVASFHLTDKNLDLPGFISIGGAADGPGFLGMNYAPFNVQNPGQPPENIRPPDGLGKGDDANSRIRIRQRLLFDLDDRFKAGLMPHLDPKAREKKADAAVAHGEIYKKAFRIVAGDRNKIFDLSSERGGVIEAYGGQRSNFGRGCLLARRLVEAGVTCVEVNLGGWDTHNANFTALKDRQLPMLDKAMGSLVKDLVDRGRWKNTVLVWMGEFGRTPRINQNAGRDHWARCWSVVVGGGAIQGGQVYGATDKTGVSVKDKPCKVEDLFATVYKAMGLDPATPIRDNLGRPSKIAEGTALKGLV